MSEANWAGEEATGNCSTTSPCAAKTPCSCAQLATTFALKMPSRSGCVIPLLVCSGRPRQCVASGARKPGAAHRGRQPGVVSSSLTTTACCPSMQSFARMAQPGGCMDERVASAVSHWAPRFTTNGVAVADFQRVTAGIERWDDWCSAWSAAAKVHEDLGREALAEERTRSAGAHLSMASVYYHFGKFLFVDHPDQMRAAHEDAVRCLTDALPYLDPPGERVEIPFEGSRMVGVLRRPHGQGPHPVVVLVPGLDSTKEEFRSTEALFLERGLATFSVDGPGQGEAEYDLPIRGDWEVPGRAIVDAVAAQAG